MARTSHQVRPPPGSQANVSRGSPTPLTPGPGFSVDGVTVHGLEGDGSEMIMIPGPYEDRLDVADDAGWRSDEDGDQHKCWQTTLIYQHIEHHPRLMRFIRPDPWTWLPVVANPGGPPLRTFLDANRKEIYAEHPSADRSTAAGRIKASHRNLIYQWALHLASALEFIHSYSFESPSPKISIVFGDLSIDSCWLSPKLSLSVLGFLNSGFRTRSGPLHVGHINAIEAFQPLQGLLRGQQASQPTLQTDLFLWGCVVYELMTGSWPGHGQNLSSREMGSLIPGREWPRLETEYLGDVVRKCWTGDITSAAELLAMVRRSITDLGSVIGEDDEVQDLNIQNLII